MYIIMSCKLINEASYCFTRCDVFSGQPQIHYKFMVGGICLRKTSHKFLWDGGHYNIV